MCVCVCVCLFKYSCMCDYCYGYPLCFFLWLYILWRSPQKTCIVQRSYYIYIYIFEMQQLNNKRSRPQTITIYTQIWLYADLPDSPLDVNLGTSACQNMTVTPDMTGHSTWYLPNLATPTPCHVRFMMKLSIAIERISLFALRDTEYRVDPKTSKTCNMAREHADRCGQEWTHLAGLVDGYIIQQYQKHNLYRFI